MKHVNRETEKQLGDKNILELPSPWEKFGRVSGRWTNLAISKSALIMGLEHFKSVLTMILKQFEREGERE